jgi:uronate dehydrogenase
VKRVVFASSNHAVGFYRRDQTIGVDVTVRPDSRYGVSKCFGEALGSLYADRYDLEVLSIRIGHMLPKPVDARGLAIWISPRDLYQLVRIGLDHPDIKNEIVYGMSDNARSWWENSNALRLGYRPQDRWEDYAAEVLASLPKRTGDDLVDEHQGGAFVRAELGGDPLKPSGPK